MRKTIILTLIAATFLSLGTALAQNDKGKVPFYEVVPKHEFFFEGFGGFSPIIGWSDAYMMNLTGTGDWVTPYAETFQNLWPWTAPKDMLTLKNPTALGAGGGFGYIAHITPVFGIMTGAEFAIYNGGVDFTSMNTGNLTSVLWTAQPVAHDLLLLQGVENYREMHQYMAVQVPLMLHFMAPMGKGKNFFYFAFGGKVGFNVKPLSKFQATGESVWYNYSFPDVSTWTDITDYTIATAISASGKSTLSPDMAEYQNILTGNANPVSASEENKIFIKDGKYNASGLFGARFVNPMASLELGFRWRFGGGCGLYTGLYADFGVLPLTKPEGGIVKVVYKDESNYDLQPQSVLCAEGLPTYHIRKSEDPAKIEVLHDYLPAATNFIRSAHAGLKLKLAFGKVKKHVAPLPIVPQKPDTVVKTVVQTVVVRDTVTQQNTVVVRDTVEKVKVIRDTVIVIKEVPQEIKDVMVELSSTLFAFNKFNLTDKAKAGLDKVAAWLNDNPDVNVEISGHTDSVGSDSYNQKLSEDRAKSVYEYFIHEGGVSSKRLSYKGYGKTRPIASNDTEEGRQQNRRVELNIIQ